MPIPSEKLQTLRYGEELVAELSASQSGWRTWVYIRPQLPDDAESSFPLPINDHHTPVHFFVRRVELSEWHLEDRWGFDMDVAIKQHPIVDDSLVVADVTILESQLVEWNCNPELLRSPAEVDYPYPPRITGTD